MEKEYDKINRFQRMLESELEKVTENSADENNKEL